VIEPADKARPSDLVAGTERAHELSEVPAVRVRVINHPVATSGLMAVRLVRRRSKARRLGLRV
jgi:hypothetical protein